MSENTYEEILFDLYHKMGELVKAKANVKVSADKTNVSVLVSKLSLMYSSISNQRILLADVMDEIMKFKDLYRLYSIVKKRHPQVVTTSLKQNMDKLLRLVCKKEAKFIEMASNQVNYGDIIDIGIIFAKETFLRRLWHEMASAIVVDVIQAGAYKILMTEAEGRIKETIGQEQNEVVSLSNVTVYLDESIYDVKWDENGMEGKAGCYSYIICSGEIESESLITDKNTIKKGVEYIYETGNTKRVTETAIGRVLMILAFDIGFRGSVCIFTDNMTVRRTWNKVEKNLRLQNYFESVKVECITRNENKKADMLCRTRRILNIPTEIYIDIVEKYEKAEALEK